MTQDRIMEQPAFQLVVTNFIIIKWWCKYVYSSKITFIGHILHKLIHWLHLNFVIPMFEKLCCLWSKLNIKLGEVNRKSKSKNY